MKSMREVVHRNGVTAILRAASGAVPRYVPFSPPHHEPLRICPGAFAHLDLPDVGEEPLGATAEEMLLNLDEGEKCRDGGEDGDRGHAHGSTPALSEGHTSPDTVHGRFVPGGAIRRRREFNNKV